MELTVHNFFCNIEGIFTEMNLSKAKSFIFATYFPSCQSDNYHFQAVSVEGNKTHEKLYIKVTLTVKILNYFCQNYLANMGQNIQEWTK